MTASKRVLSMILALMMILPLISIPVVAEESTVIWAGESFDEGSMSKLLSKPASAQIVSKDGQGGADKALKIDIKGIANPNSYPAPYYAWQSDSKIIEITDYTYDSVSNTLSGKINVDGTTYDISGTLDTGVAATCAAGTFYVYTNDMVDARTGFYNVAKAATIYNPGVTTEDDTVVYLQYKIWFEAGTKGIFASRIYSTAGNYIEVLGFKGNGTTVALTAHENAYIVDGNEVALQTEKWYTVSAEIDLTSKVRKLYVDGVYAFSAQNLNYEIFNLPAVYDLGKGKWDIFQINRNNTKASDLAGSVMIDDVCILNSNAFKTPSNIIWAGETFDAEAWTAVTVRPASAKFVTRDGADKAIQIDVKGVGNPNKYPAPYYAWQSHDTILEITDPVYDSTTNTLVGKVTVSGTTYDISGTLDTGVAATCAAGTFYVYTNGMVDARTGAYNVAQPLTVSNPKIEATDDDSVVVLQYDVYFGAGTKGIFASRIRSSAGGYIEFFGFQGNGTTVTLMEHENAVITEGNAIPLKTEKWYTVSVEVDLTSKVRKIYLDGAYAFSAQNRDGAIFELPALYDLASAKWDLFQINRNNTKASDLAGYVLIDNPCILDSIEVTADPIVPAVSITEDFESASAGTALSTVYSATTTGYNKVLSESLDGVANKFLRVPFAYGTDIGTAPTNYDKTVSLKNSSFGVANGKYAVFTVDYRPHHEESLGAGTLEIQLQKYTFDATKGTSNKKPSSSSQYTALTEDEAGLNGVYLQLFAINMLDGSLSGNNLTATGAPGMIMDEWNTVQCVLNLEDTSLSLYVNGQLYGTSASLLCTASTSNGWYHYTNASNITIGANQMLVAKCNKQNVAYQSAANAGTDFENTNYMDIDNVSLSSATEEEVFTVPSVNEEGHELLYVTVGGKKVSAENLYLTEDLVYEIKYFDPASLAYNGIISTESLASVRLRAPAGLRFATEIVDMEAFDALIALSGDEYKSVSFGTLIVPTDYLADTDFTVDALKAANKKYLEVEANYGAYYAVDDDPATTHFVGSIVNLYEENVDRDFSGIGYIKVTLWGGREYYFYSDTEHSTNVKAIAQTALEDETQSWSGTALKILTAFAAGNNMDATIATDMSGLNVLTYGDSLFWGTNGYSREDQWINKLGNELGWNLNNNGWSGMTVSKTEGNVSSGKKSMYDFLFNQYAGTNTFAWGSTWSELYQTGNPSGNPEDVELILLEGGCNDYGTAVAAPLGEIDSKDPATFLGAWNCVAEHLLNTYPNATIVFVTTWRLNPQSRPNDTISSIEYSESIIELYNEVYASNDRVALINAGDPKVSGVDMLDSEWRNEFSTDSYHLKDTGMEVMADHMLPLLWGIVMEARESK